MPFQLLDILSLTLIIFVPEQLRKAFVSHLFIHFCELTFSRVPPWRVLERVLFKTRAGLGGKDADEVG